MPDGGMLMPRVQTPAPERARQRERAKADKLEREAEALGLNARTVAGNAKLGRRYDATSPHLIPDRVLDFDASEVVHIGQVIAQIEDYRIIRGHTVVLNLATSLEFRHLLADAAAISRAENLVCVLYRIPRDLGLDDDDDT